jgi:HD superfamily phosphodiesterase
VTLALAERRLILPPGTAPARTGPAGDPGAWPTDWPRVEQAVMDLAAPAARQSYLHGPRHWRAVARVGIELCRRTPGADLGVVMLFALVHDCQRWTDGEDPGHGPRSATRTSRLAAP